MTTEQAQIAVYGLAATFSAVNAAHDLIYARAPRQRFFWLAVFGVIACLFFLKDLHASSLIASEGRWLAKDNGWYGDRRPVQAAAILFVLLTTSITYVMAGLYLRDRHRALTLAVVLALLGYLVITTISLHQLDAVLRSSSFAGMNRKQLIELLLVGILVIASMWPTLRRLSHLDEDES